MSLAFAPPATQEDPVEVNFSEPHSDLPPLRRLAAAAGSKLYYTGLPCKRGHYAPRYTITGSCTQCVAETTANNRKALRLVMVQAIEKKAASSPTKGRPARSTKKAVNNG